MLLARIKFFIQICHPYCNQNCTFLLLVKSIIFCILHHFYIQIFCEILQHPKINSGSTSEVNIFKQISPIDQDRSFLYWNELDINTRLILILVTSNKYNKDSLVGTLIHLAIAILLIFRCSRLDVFCRKGIARNFTKFTEKSLYQSLFFNKVAGLAATLLKKRLW